ncbi:MAG: sulfurtransferase TusA family protein [Actinobacteria bacterium]|nr:sulfurtransferase TusA family protein [Actinomycetota bacterium]
MKEVDVRGLSCPLPVIKTKKALEEEGDETILILMDTKVSVDNISRLLKSIGHNFKIEKKGDIYHLLIEREEK